MKQNDNYWQRKKKNEFLKTETFQSPKHRLFPSVIAYNYLAWELPSFITKGINISECPKAVVIEVKSSTHEHLHKLQSKKTSTECTESATNYVQLGSAKKVSMMKTYPVCFNVMQSIGLPCALTD